LYELDDRFETGQFLYDETSPYEFVVPESIVEGGINIIQLALLIITGGLFVLMSVFLGILIKDKYFNRSNAKPLTKA
jgi:hypothetical protein